MTEREINDGNITMMTEERKQMEARVYNQRKVLAEKKKVLKKIQSDKKN
jgi:hypothetical protein